MKLLLLDSSTKRFSLAVSDGEKVLKSRNIVLEKILSSSIVPAVDKILKSCQLTLKEIDGFAVGLGPGSFTSLRVGLSTVKAFCFALNKPVVGIPSLDLVARAAFPFMTGKQKNLCVIADARRGLVYAAVYEKSGESLKLKGDYLLTPLEDLLARIPGDALFAGDAVPLFREKIEGARRRGWAPSFAPERSALPDARQMLLPALEKFGGQKTDDAKRLVPLYLYPADCQVRR